MTLNPRIFVGPGRMTISRPGFDASDPDLNATEVLFDSRYAQVALPFQTSEFTTPFSARSVVTIPIVGAPLSTIPLLVVMYRLPGNIFDAPNGSGDVVYAPGRRGQFQFQSSSFNPITGKLAFTQLWDVLQKACDLENVYIRNELSGAYPGWVVLYYLGDLAAMAGVGGGAMFGKRGDEYGAWIAKPGADVETADEDGLFFSTSRRLAQVIGRGTVVMDGDKDVDLAIDDPGYAPLVFWQTDSAETGCMRYIDNQNVRFYRRFASNVASYNLTWWAFNQELTSAPQV